MKAKDFAKNNGLDPAYFEHWLQQSGYPVKSGMTGVSFDDSLATDDLVVRYNLFLTQQRAMQAQQQAQQQAADQAKQHALASMLITSGFNFDGYTVTKYSGYISGDDAISMERPTHGWFGGVNKDVGADLLGSLVYIRRRALAELKESAYALGCNAVIGVDFDYLTLDPETVNNQGGTLYLPFLFAVTANGNAVVIEKINQP